MDIRKYRYRVMQSIYFDNASTSFPKARGVGEAMKGYLEEFGCNVGRGGYQKAYAVSKKVYEVRKKLCHFFDAEESKNVIFTSNITQALNTVIKGLLKPGDHVLISGLEHNAVLRPLYHMRLQGISYDVIPCDLQGQLQINSMDGLIKKKTKAIIMTHGSNICAAMLPIKEVGSFCRRKGLFFIVDTAQTAGSHKISMKDDLIDALCFTGHKGLLGPQGIGGFLISESMVEGLDTMIDGGTGSLSDCLEMPEILPDRFEAGTLNLPGIYGLDKALDEVMQRNYLEIQTKEQQLMDTFVKGIKKIEGICLVGGTMIKNKECCPVLSIDCEKKDNAVVAFELDQNYGIMTRVGLHCAPLAHKTLGSFPKGTLRFSFSASNTEEEIQIALKALSEIMEKM
ncbi:MAG: aminotransferase class V-fold PLP-dependent enzyme [Eubacterium sp.]